MIQKETITGKEFMEIFHEVEGITIEDKETKQAERIAMTPVENEKVNETESKEIESEEV